MVHVYHKINLRILIKRANHLCIMSANIKLSFVLNIKITTNNKDIQMKENNNNLLFLEFRLHKNNIKERRIAGIHSKRKHRQGKLYKEI